MAEKYTSKQVVYGGKSGEAPDCVLDSESFAEYVPISELPEDVEFIDPVRPHIYHRPFFWVGAGIAAAAVFAAIVWLVVWAVK